MTLQESPVIRYPSPSAGAASSAPSSITEVPQPPDGNIPLKIGIDENDVRARQFACRLTIHNGTLNAVDVLAVNYRLGSGVTMERSGNTSFGETKKEYDQLKYDVKVSYRIAYAAYVNKVGEDFTKQLLAALRSQFSSKNFVQTYYYVFAFKLYANQMTSVLRRMDFPIASSVDAKVILNVLREKVADLPNIDLIEAKISRMNQIEQMDSNFLRPEYVTQILPGEDLEQIYIIKAKRRLSAIASYTAAFDVKLAWDEVKDGSMRHFERTKSRSLSFNVTPNPVTLSLFAVVFSFLGAVVNSIPVVQGVEPGRIIPSLWNGQFLLKYFVAAVLSVVLYNSIEMTEFRDKIRSISWRSAMFIGILCGLLSDRMLKAITGFVGQ